MVSSFVARDFRPEQSIRFELSSATAAFRIAFQWCCAHTRARCPCFARGVESLASPACEKAPARLARNSQGGNSRRSGRSSRQAFLIPARTTRATVSPRSRNAPSLLDRLAPLPTQPEQRDSRGRAAWRGAPERVILRRRPRRRDARPRARRLSKTFLLQTTADTFVSTASR